VHARLIERHADLAFGGDALAHLEAQRALDERDVLLEIEVVRVGAVDAPDLVDIAETLCGEQGGLRSVPLEMLLIAMVEPCRKTPESENFVRPFPPHGDAVDERAEVESALPKSSRPLFSSKAATS